MAYRRTHFRVSRTTHSAPFRSGMTLIETLLALAITALVLGLIYSIYHTTLTVVNDQQTRVHGPIAAMRALEDLSRSLACSLQLSTTEDPAFELKPPQPPRDKSSTLTFLTATARSNDDLQWYDILSVIYRVGTEAEEAGILFCETQEITGPSAELPPVTNIVLRGVEQFHAELFDGHEWLDEWPDRETPEMPQGARLSIKLKDSDQPPFLTEVFIPAGHTITSRLETITHESAEPLFPQPAQ